VPVEGAGTVIVISVVSEHVLPPLKVAFAVTIVVVPAVTAVAVVVVGEKGEVVSDVGFILILSLFFVKSILDIVPLLTIVVAVRTWVPPISTEAVAGVRLRAQKVGGGGGCGQSQLQPPAVFVHP